MIHSADKYTVCKKKILGITYSDNYYHKSRNHRNNVILQEKQAKKQQNTVRIFASTNKLK